MVTGLKNQNTVGIGQIVIFSDLAPITMVGLESAKLSALERSQYASYYLGWSYDHPPGPSNQVMATGSSDQNTVDIRDFKSLTGASTTKGLLSLSSIHTHTNSYR